MFHCSSNKIIYWFECFLGMVFLFSGITKSIAVKGFAMEVAQYSELYLHPALSPWSKELAVMVCGIEIMLGLCLFVKRLCPYTIVAALCLMLFFTYLTGMNYLFPTSFGSIESCGCFGEVIHLTPLGSFIKSVVLLMVAIVACLIRITDLTEQIGSGIRKALRE